MAITASNSALVIPQLPTFGDGVCRIVAMLHVHSGSALLLHGHTRSLNIQAPTRADTVALNRIVGDLDAMYSAVLAEFPLLRQVVGGTGSHSHALNPCRSAVFMLRHAEVEQLLDEVITKMGFVAALIDRALAEAAIFIANGVDTFEVENVAAPYFVGAGACPWEELLITYAVARAVRRAHPQVKLGVHILSCDELEALPTALLTGCFFIRSEAVVFSGMRPEGPTRNDANWARFLYLRRVLRDLCPDLFSASFPEWAETYPRVWADLHKKHTHFDAVLETSMEPWYDNINFMKLEGAIVTGPHTGSNVSEAVLKGARNAVDAANQFAIKHLADPSATADRASRRPADSGASLEKPDAALAKAAVLPHVVPLVTGSGAAFEMYAKYADFMIVGSAFKVGGYWENVVDPAAVAAVVSRIAQANAQSKRE
jgi:predicted TIM-barrel enzyme